MAKPPAGFAFTVARNGAVAISHHGQAATTLRGTAAIKFLAGLEAGDPQAVMARVTGNYRHGNERTAKNHPRNAAPRMTRNSLKKLFYSAFAYLVVGMLSGLFYREYTKAADVQGYTQLSIVHTHLLTLGFIVLLIVLILEKLFTLSESKLFNWFFATYNAGMLLLFLALRTRLFGASVKNDAGTPAALAG